MSSIDKGKRYTSEHEWVEEDGETPGVVLVGITDYAQEALGDIVLVELPEVGDEITAEEVLGAVESPKSVSDLFAPVTGRVVAVNEDLGEQPELVNEDCYESGWIVRIRMTDAEELAGLMDADAYGKYLEELEDE